MSCTIWLTGLPCSGKTTLAEGLKREISESYDKVLLLDGDVLRKGINSDLGFSPEDRAENLRRSAHIAQLFNENGFIVISAFITPTERDRETIRGIIKDMILVYVECSLSKCEERDTKGMYKKARNGEIKDFTGVSAPFEEPERYDIIVNTEVHHKLGALCHVISSLETGGFLL